MSDQEQWFQQGAVQGIHMERERIIALLEKHSPSDPDSYSFVVVGLSNLIALIKGENVD